MKMISAAKSQKSNIYVKNLKQVCKQVDRQVSWAVFADDDPVMLRSLSEALKNEAAAIIPAPQNLWFDADHAFEDAVVWSIEELSITTLVLVGNSAAGVPSSESIVAGKTTADYGEQGLMSSIRVAEEKRRLAAEHFAQQIQALVSMPEIGNRLISGELSMHCLFYRSESGVFTVYDPNNGSFRALIS